MTRPHPFVPPLATALLLTACIATDPDTLGKLDSGDTGEETDATGETGNDSATSAGDTDDQACAQGLDYFWPSSCPDEDFGQLPAEGCYEACEGLGDPCGVGTCSEVLVDPCPSDDGLDTCGSCGASRWLCVEGLPDVICDQIVGTTFETVDEFICFPTPEGEDPVYCRWTIEFDVTGDYLWTSGDFGQGGSYTCTGGVLAVDFDVDFTFDPETAVLHWDGTDYVPAPA